MNTTVGMNIKTPAAVSGPQATPYSKTNLVSPQGHHFGINRNGKHQCHQQIIPSGQKCQHRSGGQAGLDERNYDSYDDLLEVKPHPPVQSHPARGVDLQ